MKKQVTVCLTLILFLGALPSFMLAGVNLTGTWEGSTYVEGPGIDLLLTLVLEHKGETITGKIHDDMGYIDCEISEVFLDGNKLNFKAVAMTPDGDIDMTFKMEVGETELKGEWSVGDMAHGSWTAVKK
ncbi:MAG: hypothetical protein JXB26_11450 [Candidatus Aminicenantes bacterium]|nr:hypothetical protein [Candidatus Aminicenantes bacterium]